MTRKKRTFALPILAIVSVGGLLGHVFLRDHSPHPDFNGLPAPLRTVHVRVHGSPSALHAHLLTVTRNLENARSRCLADGHRMLGLSEAEAEYAWHGKDISAFYVIGSDTMHVTSGASRAEVRHESVHAIHDQYANLRTVLQQDRTTDAHIAVRALAEGLARNLSGEYPTGAGMGTTIGSFARFLSSEVAPAYIQERVAGDPMAGMELSARSVRDIAFGATQLVEPPVLALDDGDELLCSDRLGIAGVAAALKQAGASESEIAHSLSAWLGDRMDLIRASSGETRVVWSLNFATREAAASWTRGPGLLIPLTRPATATPVYTILP